MAAPTNAYLPARFHRCPSCGLLFQPERLVEELRELYGKEYFDEHAGWGGYFEDPEQRRYEAKVRLRLVRRYCREGRLLEVGAATGEFLHVTGQAGFASFGIEPVEAAAALARERYGVEVITSFLEDVSLEEREFDVVCAWHVVEHMARPLPMLEALRKSLRPGGHLMLEVPNIGSFKAQRTGAAWAVFQPLHHVGHYSPESLTALLRRAGFEVIATETVPFLSYVLPARWRPGELARRVLLSLRARIALHGTHPSKHELLRAIAVAPR